MSFYRIQGGNRLTGTVSVSGSKNSALAILASVVVSSGKVVLTNVPTLRDTKIKSALLEAFGANVEWIGDTMIVDCSNIHFGYPDQESVQQIRTSFYMLGPLLARLGKVQMPAPGGCNIGARPVDLHLKGLELLGAKVSLDGGVYYAETKGLVGTEIYLDFPSAGATQHLMATATLAKGVTTIKNAALEPEVVHLANFLNSLSDGPLISGAGTSTIEIQGTDSLGGSTFRIPEDRIQAGTFMLAGIITGGSVKVEGILPEHQSALNNKLREAGAFVEEEHDSVTAGATKRLQGINIKTLPYPGFPTDIQQPTAAVLALAEGESVIDENIYESRIGHVGELVKMGARMQVFGRLVKIDGVDRLSGATVFASDLRAGAALVLAGLAAEGETIVRNIHFIERGYENFAEALSGLGATIERVENTKQVKLGDNLQ